MTVNPHNQPFIIVFDGYCNLCCGTVQFILKRDQKKKFLFAPLQGSYGQALLQSHKLPATDPGTFILVQGNRIVTRSTAALRVVKQLPGLWPLLYFAIIIPPVIRDIIYNWVARHRYQWFGRRTQCWLPKPEWADRFMD